VGHTSTQRFLFGTEQNSLGAINSHPQKSNFYFLIFYFALVKNQKKIKKKLPQTKSKLENAFLIDKIKFSPPFTLHDIDIIYRTKVGSVAVENQTHIV